MKFYTSYFYQVRFLPSNYIPVSTAKFDPSWFHENKGPKHVFLDPRGVINGLRVPIFSPGRSTEGLCQTCRNKNQENCSFLAAYRKQLDALDFNDTINRFSRFAEKVQADFGILGEPIFVLLVHEAPSNPCSERRVIQQWFRANGVDCPEYGQG